MGGNSNEGEVLTRALLWIERVPHHALSQEQKKKKKGPEATGSKKRKKKVGQQGRGTKRPKKKLKSSERRFPPEGEAKKRKYNENKGKKRVQSK